MKKLFGIYKKTLIKISPFLFILSVGFIIVIATNNIDNLIKLLFVDEPDLFISVLVAIFSGVLVFKYLEGAKFFKRIEFKDTNVDSHKENPTNLDKRLRYLETKIENILEKIEGNESEEIFTEGKSEVKDLLRTYIENRTNQEFLEVIDEAYGERIIKDKRISELLEKYDDIAFRVNYEINRLSRRANLNLTIGAITTIFAAFFLGYTVLNSELSFENLSAFLIHFLPRLSVVIFIEIFAFFFLKIYKSNLNDVKYYQNELTNIEFKVSSITTAFYIDNKDLVNKLTEKFSDVERNFILKKGETTSEIEKNKIDFENEIKLNSLIENIVKTVAGKFNSH